MGLNPVTCVSDRLKPGVHVFNARVIVPMVRRLADMPVTEHDVWYSDGTLWIHEGFANDRDDGPPDEYDLGSMEGKVGILPLLAGLAIVVATPTDTFTWLAGDAAGTALALAWLFTGAVFAIAALDVWFDDLRVAIYRPATESVAADGGDPESDINA